LKNARAGTRYYLTGIIENGEGSASTLPEESSRYSAADETLKRFDP
jgi:hypothetical protein